LTSFDIIKIETKVHRNYPVDSFVVVAVVVAAVLSAIVV
jgi:hypothetical protein